MPLSWTKDDSEVLDYEFDFAGKTNGVPGAKSDYLKSGETILSYTLSAPTGITLEQDTLTKQDTCVRFWARGGTPGQRYRVTVRVITSEARVVERSHVMTVVAQR